MAVLAGLLGLIAIGGEFYARNQLRTTIESGLSQAGVAVQDLSIDRPGLLLNQLAQGVIPQADFTATSVTFNDLEISHVTASTHEITTNQPTHIGSLSARGELTADALNKLGSQHGLPEAVDIVLSNGRVYLEAELFGHALRAGTTLTADEREIRISVDSVSVADIEVDLATWGVDVVQFFGAPTISLDALPAGLRLTGIEVELSSAGSAPSEQVLAVTLTGSDLTLQQ